MVQNFSISTPRANEKLQIIFPNFFVPAMRDAGNKGPALS